MATKEKMLRVVAGLLPDATVEDAMERLLFLAKVERGMAQADADKTVPHAEAKGRMGVSVHPVERASRPWCRYACIAAIMPETATWARRPCFENGFFVKRGERLRMGKWL